MRRFSRLLRQGRRCGPRGNAHHLTINAILPSRIHRQTSSSSRQALLGKYAADLKGKRTYQVRRFRFNSPILQTCLRAPADGSEPAPRHLEALLLERGKRIGGSLEVQYGSRAFEQTRANTPVLLEAASNASLSPPENASALGWMSQMRPGGHCLCICCIFWERPAANFS
jgi:hypothetical protein